MNAMSSARKFTFVIYFVNFSFCALPQTFLMSSPFEQVHYIFRKNMRLIMTGYLLQDIFYSLAHFSNEILSYATQNVETII